MPDTAFNEQTASPAQLREEAEQIDDTRVAIERMRERGHLDTEGRVLAMRLVSSLKFRADDLRRLAVLAERQPHQMAEA